jgi:hypothetical protein
MADILSQIIYLGLNLDKKSSIPQKKRSFSNVKKALKTLSQSTKLYSEMNDFSKSEKFKYLSAYVNTTKHRSLIPTTYSVSFIEPTHGLKITEFKYNNHTYKAKWSKEFIGTDRKFIEEALVNIGNEINLSIEGN